jgi:hypothetical protein
MTVRVRGIYTTALTSLFESVVQASPPIRERFEESFPFEPADAIVETTDDRQGVGVFGPGDASSVTETLSALGRDTFVWGADLPRGAVYAGEVTETLESGALVTCQSGGRAGFLPYSKTARRVETGDRIRVQVDDPYPPWSDRRPVLDTTVRIRGSLATLVRGGTTDTGGPELADVLPTDPPEGWAVDWTRDADEADLDALGDTLDRLRARAIEFDEAFEGADAPTDVAPHCYWDGETTNWVWFGRESREALDDRRRSVTATMDGHHRIKAGSESASAAVDFVEDVCPDAGGGSFPFEAVTRQFGPRVGETLTIGHGKPDGRRIELGPGEVENRTADGEVTVCRDLTPGGTYDAIGTEIQEGDVAITKFKEGRWWYPTVYRGADGDRRGTYVNICTPVELFPREARYVDLHVDVVKHPEGTVERVDDDELDAAVEAGHVSEPLAQKARSVADAVSNAL